MSNQSKFSVKYEGDSLPNSEKTKMHEKQKCKSKPYVRHIEYVSSIPPSVCYPLFPLNRCHFLSRSQVRIFWVLDDFLRDYPAKQHRRICDEE